MVLSSCPQIQWTCRAALMAALLLHVALAPALILHAHEDGDPHLHQVVASASQDLGHDHGHGHGHHNHDHAHSSGDPAPDDGSRQVAAPGWTNSAGPQAGPAPYQVRVLLVLGADPLRSTATLTGVSAPTRSADAPPPLLGQGPCEAPPQGCIRAPRPPTRPPTRSGTAAVLATNHALLF